MGMFTKKTIEELQAQADSPHHEKLARALGPVNLVALGVGGIIGAGIFVLTGTAAADHAGPALVISFIISAIACGFAGLCYAEFASIIPVSGSAYTYSYATMGELFAWILGWDLLLEYALGASTVAAGWSGYFVSFLSDFGIHIPRQYTLDPFSSATLADGTVVQGIVNLPALAIVLATTIILIGGIKQSARFNTLIVGVKVTVILAFIALGIWHIKPENWIPFIPENTGEFGKFGLSGILSGASVIFFAYIGFDAVSTAAQEAKNPQRDMPIGMLGSLAVCTVLYILVAGVLTGVVHYSQLGVPDPIAIAVNTMGMPWFSFLVKIGALLGLSSVILVLFYAQTRISYAIAKDGLLPQTMGRIHPKFKTPHIATLTAGVIMMMMAAFVPIKILHEMVNFGTLFAFAMVCAGVFWLRRSHPELKRPFACPLVPWVPLGGIVSCVALMAGLPMQTFQNLLIWFALGFAVYFFYGRKHSTTARAHHDL